MFRTWHTPSTRTWCELQQTAGFRLTDSQSLPSPEFHGSTVWRREWDSIAAIFLILHPFNQIADKIFIYTTMDGFAGVST